MQVPGLQRSLAEYLLPMCVFCRLLSVAALVVLTSCERGEAREQAELPSSALVESLSADGLASVYRLVEEQSFGWAELGDSARPLTDVERKFSGGVLGLIRSVAEDRDGAVYVLDASFQKVVVFNADGSLKSVIRGGFGRGPGEFLNPRSLAVDTAGDIAVLDQALRRVTTFNAAGSVITTFQVPGAGVPLQLMESGGRIMVRRHERAGTPTVLIFDRTGTLIDSSMVADERDEEIGSFGEAGVLGKTQGDSVAYARVIPGQWRLLSDPTTEWRGRSLEPDAKGGVLTGETGPLRYFPLSVRGMVGLENGDILQFFMRFSPEAIRRRRLVGEYYLVVLSPRGQTKALVAVPDAQLGTFAPGRQSGSFYLTDHDPFPRVVRYRLEARQ